MTTDDYMLKLYEMKGHLEGLVMMLERAGLRMAASEIDREADELGVRTAQIEGVLQEYQIEIALADRAAQGLKQ
ncbi:hypothetical protein ACDI10_16655 [Vreelandella venusta]|uniref:hypothetical protein n=1 Tax=Vreelandella venusta TaxID=44935 RepID=UPI0035581AEE